jgi:hypothetical protein
MKRSRWEKQLRRSRNGMRRGQDSLVSHPASAPAKRQHSLPPQFAQPAEGRLTCSRAFRSRKRWDETKQRRPMGVDGVAPTDAGQISEPHQFTLLCLTPATAAAVREMMPAGAAGARSATALRPSRSWRQDDRSYDHRNAFCHLSFSIAQTVLPPQIFSYWSNLTFWRYIRINS